MSLEENHREWTAGVAVGEEWAATQDEDAVFTFCEHAHAKTYEVDRYPAEYREHSHSWLHGFLEGAKNYLIIKQGCWVKRKEA